MVRTHQLFSAQDSIRSAAVAIAAAVPVNVDGFGKRQTLYMAKAIVALNDALALTFAAAQADDCLSRPTLSECMDDERRAIHLNDAIAAVQCQSRREDGKGVLIPPPIPAYVD